MLYERHAAAGFDAARHDTSHDFARELLEINLAVQHRLTRGERQSDGIVFYRHQLGFLNEVLVLREVERHDAKPVALRIVESDVRQVVRYQSTEQGGNGVEKITQVEMSNHRIGSVSYTHLTLPTSDLV